MTKKPQRGRRAAELVVKTVQQQRQIATAIKNAREMTLLPYPGPTPAG
jgi:small subunit ribosomal protein S18